MAEEVSWLMGKNVDAIGTISRFNGVSSGPVISCPCSVCDVCNVCLCTTL